MTMNKLRKLNLTKKFKMSEIFSNSNINSLFIKRLYRKWT